jgi:hypothetical protein
MPEKRTDFIEQKIPPLEQRRRLHFIKQKLQYIIILFCCSAFTTLTVLVSMEPCILDNVMAHLVREEFAAVALATLRLVQDKI